MYCITAFDMWSEACKLEWRDGLSIKMPAGRGGARLSPSTQEAEVGGSLSSRSTRATE